MDPERFKQLGLTAIRWADKAHRLYIAADVFARPAAQAMSRALFERGAGDAERLEAIQHCRTYGDASNLLYGLAIENAYKTRQILDGKVSIENGKFKDMRSDHNILEMARAHGVIFSQQELDVMKCITFATVTMGKYPIALSAEKQKSFTGRTYGADYVAPLTKRIVLELLKESPYTDIFLKGRHSGIDDTG
jgi:hypothetical protein